MKTIVYRGGLLKFQLPEDWVEEYGEEGGGTFYLDEEDSGTLRVNVLTFQGGSSATGNAALEVLQTLEKKPGVVVESLPTEKTAIARYFEDGDEDGELLRIWYWQIACIIQPEYLHIAIFSYSVLKSLEDSPIVSKDLAMINKSLREIEFAANLKD